MKTYCRRMDISDENFIRKYIAAFIYDKLENGNMPSIFAYYGSISKNEARRIEKCSSPIGDGNHLYRYTGNNVRQHH